MNKKFAPILIVDDEPEMCWILENVIRKTGFACKTALSAKEALNLAENDQFGMAFLDAKLPDIDGLELARQLRKKNTRLPIVIVSGYFYIDDLIIEGVVREGLITAFIGKPFEHDEIVDVITRFAFR